MTTASPILDRCSVAALRDRFAGEIILAGDASYDERRRIWTRETFDALTPFSTGGVYVNFMGNEGAERVAAAYGLAYARMAALKARWDPDSVFRINQNVRPAAAG
jgi:hypothetical protein